jgi:DNA primase large subunit
VHLAALARYPFLPEAGEHVAAEGPSLEELLSERVYASARARGKERLRLAIENGEVPAPTLSEASGHRELLEELLAYVYARILACAMDDAYVVRRHALAEAVRARAFLAAERDPGLLARAAEAVGLAFEPAQGGAYRAHFTEYLRYAVHLKDVEWKLVSQPLSRGFVEMDADKASRLVQEALRRRIETELPKPLAEEVEKAVAADLPPLVEAARLRKEKMGTDAGFGPVDLPLLPPCMKHILGQLHAGENVAHSGRFAITSFLHAIGMKTEEIMTLFAQAPDFREDLTRYQVEHITGVTSGTTYSPPSCQAMQTFGICYNADDTCRSRKRDGSPRVVHPLSYYRFKVWLRDRDKPRSEPPAAPAASPPPDAT